MPRGRKEQASADDVFEAARSVGDPAFGNVEVAERLPIGAERTRKKLNDLVDEGVLCRKKIGNSNVYWINGR